MGFEPMNHKGVGSKPTEFIQTFLCCRFFLFFSEQKKLFYTYCFEIN